MADRAHLLDTRYKDRPRVTLVCDNLNTHTRGRVMRHPAAKARACVRRIHLVYTPKHGSWLNVPDTSRAA